MTRTRPKFSTGSVLLSGLLMLGCLQIYSSAAVIDFEPLPDGTVLSTQYAGLTFENAVILTAGISLNEFEFPPHSGENVGSDNAGPITILFSSPITGFSGYFTYAEPLILTAFDASMTEVARSVSAFSNNEAVSGNPGSTPNELLGLTAVRIQSVTITGDPSGGSFAIDDITYVSTVPEPASFFLFVIAGSFFVFASRRKAP